MSALSVERLRPGKHMTPLDFALDGMGASLELRGHLGEGDRRREQAGLVERPERFASARERHCETRRDQLDPAEAVARTLRRALRRHRQRVRQ